MMPNQSTPPRSDELEVSIFGPGYGECIVIHVGEQKWLIIDSCVDPDDKKPVALAYLQEIGVDVAQDVVLVAATHWHDDHVRGLARIVRACKTAQFCCSGALKSKEFFELGQLYQDAPIDIPPGPAELNEIFAEIISRKENGHYKPIKWSINDTVLLRDKITVNGKVHEIVLDALSPSDEMVNQAIAELANTLAEATSNTISKLVPSRPNHVSVAMSLTIGQRSILLGSDLEQTKNNLLGWSAVCESTTRRQVRAAAYKVAHHGSETGFHERIWDDLLEPSPLMMVTPFKNGWHKLPTEEYQAKLLEKSDRVYLTADPTKSRAPKKRTKKVEAVINQLAKNRRVSAGPVGHVRWRAPIEEPNAHGKVELFWGAYKLGEAA
jgi:beta-lactamase superfamily II metal-dependent hydrolase